MVLNLASDTARKGGMASLLAAARLRRFGVGVGVVRSAPVLSGNRPPSTGPWTWPGWIGIGRLASAAGLPRARQPSSARTSA